jgi:DNA-directed RNA polymerase II subunit RPB1
MILSAAANFFISTKTSGPVNGQVQDSVVGCYELTRSAVRLDKYHAMGLFAAAGIEPPRFDEKPADHLYTGRDVVSLLFAATPVNYSRPPSSYSEVYAPYVPFDPSETLTVMEQGRLVRGVLDKRSIGAKQAGGLFHLVSREFGPQRALDSIFALQQVALQFLLYRGFTVGTADLLPSPGALAQIRALVSSVVQEAGVVTDRLLRGEIVPPIDNTVHGFYEQQEIEALKIDTAQIMRWILGSIRPDSNGFFRMIAVQSKGSNPNFINVSGAIGQTTINGERIREQFAFRRTLPYYPRFATDPAAYGFVANSYMTGMRSGEFIFQDMNGRFDLINKALSTSRTGYFMRKGVMNNQSSVVDNHRRVTKDTKVVQFLYGEDGLDARELEKVAFPTVPLSDAALRARAGLDLREAGAAGDAAELAAAHAAADQAVAKIREDRDVFRRAFARVEASNLISVVYTESGGAPKVELLMPVNVGRIVEGVFIAARGAAPLPLSAAGLLARIERVWDLCARLPYALINEIQERRRTPVPPHKAAAASLLCLLVRAELSPSVLARLSDEQLSFVIEAVRQRYSLSLVGYGSAVGVLAAQALCEPLTQYMLDSHHRSVAGGTNKSGLIRVEEIYGARPVADEQSPAMLLPLRPGALGAPAGALGVAQAIANSVEHVTLRSFVRQYDILLEPYGAPVFPAFAGDRVFVAEFERAHPLVRPPGDLSNWCFRFAVDKAALVLKAVDLELIVGRLRRIHPAFYVVHTPEAVPEVVVRGWLRASAFRRGGDDEERARALLEEVLDTPIRGIAGVARAKAERATRHVVAEDGALVKENTLVVSTVGTNLYHACLNSAVDASQAISTSVGDTLKMLGIEAARAKIISETRAFMEENTPNLRHVQIYSDEMSKTGKVTSVERGGLGAREHNNVLLRMAYGDPIRVLTDATLAGAKCKIYGIAAPQILGSIPQVGSLYNSLVVCESFVRDNVQSVDSVLDNL